MRSRLFSRFFVFSVCLSSLSTPWVYAQTADNRVSPTTIEVGMFSCKEEEGNWIRNEIRSFTEANPNINVKTLALSQPERWNQPIETLPALVKNVMAIDSGMGYEVAYLASHGDIVPIDSFVSNTDELYDVYPQNMFDAVTFNGKIWGIPLFADQILLACNIKAFEAAGLTEPPKTWEELIDYAQQMTLDVDGDGSIDQYGLCMARTSRLNFILATMMLQSGGQLFENSQITLSDPKIQDSINRLDSMLHADYFLHNSDEYKSAKLNPTLSWAMQFVRPQSLRKDINGTADFRMAVLPTSGKNVIANNGSLYLVVRKSTPEKEAASWEFIKWITRKDTALAEELIYYPARLDYSSRNDFQAFYEGNTQNMEVISEGVALLKDIGPSNIKGRAFASDFILNDSLKKAYRTKQPLLEIMKESLDEANSMMSPIMESRESTQSTSLKLFK